MAGRIVVAGRRILIPLPTIFGALLAFGTFSSGYYPVSAGFVLWAIWIVARERIYPPAAVTILTISIWLTAPLAQIPVMPLVLGLLVLSIGTISRHVRSDRDATSFFFGLLCGVSLQIYAAFLTWGSPRPALLSLNASQVAQTGLVFWLIMPELPKSKQILAWLPAAVHMGVGMARAPIIVAFVYLILRPSKPRAIMFVAMFAFFLLAGYSQETLSRISPGTTERAWETRIDLLDGPETDPVEATGKPRVSITGYGLGNYYEVSGLRRPHNVFVLLFYEMGVLAAIPTFLLGWAVFTRKIPFSVFLALFLLWQVTEEAAGRVEGYFTTCAVLLAVWRVQPTRSVILQAIRARLRSALRVAP